MPSRQLRLLLAPPLLLGLSGCSALLHMGDAFLPAQAPSRVEQQALPQGTRIFVAPAPESSPLGLVDAGAVGLSSLAAGNLVRLLFSYKTEAAALQFSGLIGALGGLVDLALASNLHERGNGRSAPSMIAIVRRSSQGSEQTIMTAPARSCTGGFEAFLPRLSPQAMADLWVWVLNANQEVLWKGPLPSLRRISLLPPAHASRPQEGP